MKKLQDTDNSNSLPRINSSERLSLFSYTYAQTANEDFRPHSTTPKNQKPIKTYCKGILNSISPSPNKEMVAVAGRDILKIYSTGVNPAEIVNLKGVSKTNLNYSSNDVKWGNSSMTNIVVSASSSGAIMLFDLNKSSNDKLDRTITEHLRSVHRICFHPFDHSLIISASQDGTMKIWDLRTKSRARQTFDGKSESVRDVQFNPKSNYEFASVFDNGSLQTWDIRNPVQFERKWYLYLTRSAHNGLALTLDYDPTGSFIATGGRDKVIKIWDPKSESRNCIHSIQTIAAVSTIKWRPGFKSHLATASLSHDNAVHIWDLNSPNIPMISLEHHDNVATCLLWNDSYTIWSCSKDESFVQIGVGNGFKPNDQLNKSFVHWNCFGNIGFTGETKPKVTDGDIDSVSLDESGLNIEIVDSETFDYPKFCYLATYMIFDDDVYKSCEHNKIICAKIGLHDLAQIWHFISVLYGQEKGRNLSELHSLRNESIGQSKIFNFLRDDSFLSKPDIREDSLQSQLTEQIPVLQGIQISPKLKNKSLGEEVSYSDESEDEILLQMDKAKEIVPILDVETSEIEDVIEIPLDSHKYIEEIFNLLIEETNVQMLVFLSLILEKSLDLSSFNLEIFFYSYIEQLHRFQLYPQATKITQHTSINSIKEMNQEHTLLQTSCGCGGLLDQNRPCEKCGGSVCGLCHKRVKRLFQWCQWCGHGGHLECLDLWFEENDACPTGCGHICSF